jgi:putative membrane protein
MTLFHFYLRLVQKNFQADKNVKSERFYRIINEVPTVLLVIIVCLVVFQPRF